MFFLVQHHFYAYNDIWPGITMPPWPYWRLDNLNDAYTPITKECVYVYSNLFDSYNLRMRDSYLNPSESIQNKPFWLFFLTKRIHETNLLKIASRNESTKRIFQKQTYESNPRYKSLRFGFANSDLRIQNLRIRKDLDLRISIFKDSFCAIVLRICKDS